MATLRHQVCPSTLPLLHSSSQSPILSKSQLSVWSKPLRPSFSLFATQPTSSSHSSSSIFLPVLENARIDQQEPENEQEEQEDENLTDPIVRFFKSRTSTSTQDPTHQGKLSLQKNRRTSWRLSPEFQSDSEPDIEDVFTREESQHMGSASSDPMPLPEGIVGEIMQIARELPENSTLGEQLGPFEGRISATECVEVLGLMGEEGMVTCCLYFFEWMRLQEPSLVTPRSCTVLFPILGTAGMGDKLMILFRNLPQNKEFGDVHVYNAAISGLLCCRRYKILHILLSVQIFIMVVQFIV